VINALCTRRNVASIAARERRPASPEPAVGAIAPAVVLVIGMVAAVNLAIPELQASSLHPSVSATAWIVDSHTLVSRACALAAAALVAWLVPSPARHQDPLDGGGGLLLSFATASTPYPLYGLLLALVGGGMGLALPPLSGMIVHTLPPSHAGVGSGLNSTTRELGSALGVAVLSTVLTTRFASHLAAALRNVPVAQGQAIRQSCSRPPSSPISTRRNRKAPGVVSIHVFSGPDC
jgi:hypothetical protein